MDETSVIPKAGDIWQDQFGDVNLILVSDSRLKRCTILVLTGGRHGTIYDHEPWHDWNDPNSDGMPFYRVQLA